MQSTYPKPAFKSSGFKRIVTAFFCSIGVLSSLPACAQNVENVIFKDTVFISITGREVQTRDSAFYIRVLSPADSGRINVKEYTDNGKLYLTGKSLTVDKLTLDGRALTFFPDGKKEADLNYRTGSLIGLCYYYYHNGVLREVRDYGNAEAGKWANGPGGSYLLSIYKDSTGKVMVEHGNGYLKEQIFVHSPIVLEGNVVNGKQEGEWSISDQEGRFKTVERFKNGLLVEGICHLTRGKTHTFHDYEVAPEFPGGQMALNEYIRDHLVYPHALKRAGIGGRVLATFVVGSMGLIENVKIIKSVQSDLDKEVVHLIKGMPAWQPGIQNGIPVRVIFTLPVSFNLTD